MPIQQIGEDPLGALLRVVFRGIFGQLREQPRTQGSDPLVPLRHCLGGIARRRFRARYFFARRRQFTAALFQPVAQSDEGHAVVPVVALDHAAHLLGDVRAHAGLQEPLHPVALVARRP